MRSRSGGTPGSTAPPGSSGSARAAETPSGLARPSLPCGESAGLPAPRGRARDDRCDVRGAPAARWRAAAAAAGSVHSGSREPRAGFARAIGTPSSASASAASCTAAGILSLSTRARARHACASTRSSALGASAGTCARHAVKACGGAGGAPQAVAASTRPASRLRGARTHLDRLRVPLLLKGERAHASKVPHPHARAAGHCPRRQPRRVERAESPPTAPRALSGARSRRSWARAVRRTGGAMGWGTRDVSS